VDLTAQAGLTLVVETLLALRTRELVGERLRLRRRRRGFDEYEKLQALVLLLASGGERVEDVRQLRQDVALQRMLGGTIPSPDGLHDFLAAFHDEEATQARPARGAFVPVESEALRALAAVNTEWVARSVVLHAPTRATLDLDATVIESHKRDARMHYLGGRGYQPTAVLWAEEDLVVADEYRDGNVPAAHRVCEVAQRAFGALPPSVTERFFRGDSACYEGRLLKWLCRSDIGFTVSAYMSRELRAVCASPSVKWKLLEDRADAVCAYAEVEFAAGNWPRRARPLRYVAVRLCGKQGRLFSDGAETKYLAVATNRDGAAADLVRWHWEKAGTVEHLHDVTKNELGGRIPPSGRFGANAAWYRLNLLTYNVLTTLKRHALPQALRHARPRRLRYEVFGVAAVLREHARQLTAQLGPTPLTVDELVAARGRLLQLHARLGPLLAPSSP